MTILKSLIFVVVFVSKFSVWLDIHMGQYTFDLDFKYKNDLSKRWGYYNLFRNM